MLRSGARMNSVLFDMSCCLVCEKPHPQAHHIFYGTSDRAIADKLGYIAPLCLNHHTGAQGVHTKNKALDLKLKRYAQKHFEETHTREEFLQLFTINYLGD